VSTGQQRSPLRAECQAGKRPASGKKLFETPAVDEPLSNETQPLALQQVRELGIDADGCAHQALALVRSCRFVTTREQILGR